MKIETRLKKIGIDLSDFKREQMWEMHWGLEHGLTPDQVKKYAKSKYNWRQMREIRWGFEHGLSIEQVKTYAKPEINYFEMDLMKLRLIEENEKLGK